MKVLLVAVNSKYIHTSLAVRALTAYADSPDVSYIEFEFELYNTIYLYIAIGLIVVVLIVVVIIVVKKKGNKNNDSLESNKLNNNLGQNQINNMQMGNVQPMNNSVGMNSGISLNNNVNMIGRSILFADDI